MAAPKNSFPWTSRLDSLDCTADEYISANAGSLTDNQIAEVFRKASGRKVTSEMVTHRRARELYIPKVGGLNGGVKQIVSQSPFAKYDSPPQIESDNIVILPDIQAPYHEADFLNRVLDLCDSWGVKDCILAGDLLENSSLTHFDPAWLEEKHIDDSAIPDKLADELIDLMGTLPTQAKNKLRQFIEKKGRKSNRTASGAGQEWHSARIAIREMCNQFDRLIWIMGNHEGRILKQMQSPMLPQDLKRLFLGDDARVETAPYYYCIVKSNSEEWRVIHPKSSGRDDAQWYASKYLQNVIMCHSHHWLMSKDRSGKYYAISTGCVVDESRLPYVSQRDTKMHKHLLGATILRNGHPWLLGEDSAWDDLKRLK